MGDRYASMGAAGVSVEGRLMRLETIRIALLAGLLALGVSACGTRSSLEAPASDDRTATAESGQGKKEGEAPKPHRGFVLDGFIR